MNARAWVWCLLLAGVAGAQPRQPPETTPTLVKLDATATLHPPVSSRARITVSKAAITLRPLRGPVTQVCSLVSGLVPADHLSGQHLVALDNALAEQALFVFSDDDARVEVAIDQTTPWEVVSQVLTSSGTAFAFVVQTPEGERTVDLEVPTLNNDIADDLLSLGVEGGVLYTGEGKKTKSTVPAVVEAVRAFQKARSKGRPPRQRVKGRWECLDTARKPQAGTRCWRGEVALSAASKTAWSELLPLAAAAQAVVPNVVLALF